MATAISSDSAYCTAAQMGMYFDTRELDDLCDDTNTGSDYRDSDMLTAILQASSGEVEAACLVGGRYAVADLEALTGNSAALLQSLVADLSMQKLRNRRGRAGEKDLAVQERNQQMLKDLREGVRIFGLQEVADAGLMEAQFQDVNTKALANGVVYQSSRYFGTRSADVRGT